MRHAQCPVLTVAHSPQEPYLYDIAGTEDEVAKGPAGAVLQQKSSVSATGSHVGWPLVTMRDRWADVPRSGGVSHDDPNDSTR